MDFDCLSINNWNEDKNNTTQAIKHLATLKLNLKDDIRQAENLLSITEKGIHDQGNGIWKVFYRNVFLGYFNEKQLRNKQKSIRLDTNLV